MRRRFVLNLAHAGLRGASVSIAAAITLSLIAPAHALAQGTEKAAAAAEAPATAAADASATAADAPASSEASTSDDAGADKSVTTGDVLTFRQKEVAAQMTELEERMFRLSEALKALEPENSSRLMLGLKFSREQLILHQMQEAQELLAKLALDDAVKQEKDLILKLDRLQALLLSTDLDFALQLERLRQMREILMRLGKAIREEERERDNTSDVAKKQKELEDLKNRQAALNEIIAREKSHIEGTTPLAAATQLSADEEKSTAALATEQKTTETSTAQLAEQTTASTGAPSADLAAAQSSMAAAAESLGAKKTADALPQEQAALAALEREAAALAARAEKLEQQLSKPNFEGMKNEQVNNRSATEGIGELTRKLGDSGQETLASLNKAGGSMSQAEGSLGQGEADDAEGQQDQAVKDLKDAYEKLREEQQKLLEQVRAEVKKRVIEGLTIMLERQIAIRESTVSLAPKVRDGSRTAIKSLTGLSEAEGAIADIANDLITLVEETEFGIALPAALQVVRDQMEDVEGALAEGNASDKVIAAERQIESDLQDLLAAMKRMPSKGKPKDSKSNNNPRDRERELNRLLAELKMIRLMQLRVNRETLSVDEARQEKIDSAAAEIERELEAVTDRQVHVHDATERLNEERGDELQ